MMKRKNSILTVTIMAALLTASLFILSVTVRADEVNCSLNDQNDMVCDQQGDKGQATVTPLGNTDEEEQTGTTSGTGEAVIIEDSCNPSTHSPSDIKVEDGKVVVKTNSNHGYTRGNKIEIEGAEPDSLNGTFTIDVIDTKTFSFSAGNIEPNTTISGNVKVKQEKPDNCDEEETDEEEKNKKIEQLEKELEALEKLLKEKEGDLQKWVDSLTPKQQEDFAKAMQDAVGGGSGSGSGSGGGMGDLLKNLMGGGKPGSQNPMQQMLNNIAQGKNPLSGMGNNTPGANVTPGPAVKCTNDQMADGSSSSKAEGDGHVFTKEATDNLAGISAKNQLCGAGWGPDKSKIAQCIARKDSAGTYWCAAGVQSVLSQLGYPVKSGNAHQWYDSPPPGWKEIACEPANCPEGAVLAFNRNPGRTCSSAVDCGTGACCGHVEVVTGSGSNRKYVSDAARPNYGGSVKNNPSKAYVYEGEPPKQIGNLAKQCAQELGISLQ